MVAPTRTLSLPEPVAPGRIGPNAVLQLLPVLEAEGGRGLAERMMAEAGLSAPPGDHGLMDERPAARLHRAVRSALGERAAPVLAEAGRRTADYILAHRIPVMAQRLLRALPGPVAARILTRAIAKHAWTFAGSGAFRVVSMRPLVVEISDNPLVRHERAEVPLCVWHEAVLTRLYTALAGPGWTAREVACAAAGAPACRFEIGRD